MKILFLDIDGVLNSQRSFYALGHKKARLRDAYNDSYYARITKATIDEIAVGLINRVIKETRAKVVVSSTHRKHFRDSDNPGQHKLFELNNYLMNLGLRCDVIGATPDSDSGHRGTEIKQWLDSHKMKFTEQVDKYAIIDDDSDFLDHQLPFFIHTSMDNGMTLKNYKALITLLKD
jgi:hypothetical protein